MISQEKKGSSDGVAVSFAGCALKHLNARKMREYLVVCFLSCRVKESCPGEQRIDRIKYSLNPIETYYNIQVVWSSLSR